MTPQWFSVAVVYEVSVSAANVEDDFEVRLVVERAADEHEATKRAEQLVGVVEDAYLNEFGEEVQWTCVDVLDVQRVFPADDSPDGSLGEGTEVYSFFVSKELLEDIKGQLADRS